MACHVCLQLHKRVHGYMLRVNFVHDIVCSMKLALVIEVLRLINWMLIQLTIN